MDRENDKRIRVKIKVEKVKGERIRVKMKVKMGDKGGKGGDIDERGKLHTRRPRQVNVD